MSWATKYRPTRFQDLVGQEQAIKTLRGYLKAVDSPSALLFYGPTGTGKTTMARMFSRYLNCETHKACGTCPSCLAFDAGISSHPDYKELNAAEARGIDDVRALISSAFLMPQFRKRIIVIDEAHQLTPQALQSLLKPLEEPSASTIWMICTTDPQKLPTTILGRLQKIQTRTVDAGNMIPRLKTVAEAEALPELNDDLWTAIAERSGGHMRDALTLMEGVAAAIRDTKAAKKGSPTVELTDEKLNKILNSVEASAVSDTDTQALSVLLHLYGKNLNNVLRACFMTTDWIPVVNKMLQFNEYVLAQAILEEGKPTTFPSIWPTAANRLFLTKVQRVLPKFWQSPVRVERLASILNLLTGIRSDMQSFAVPEKFLVSSRLSAYIMQTKATKETQ